MLPREWKRSNPSQITCSTYECYCTIGHLITYVNWQQSIEQTCMMYPLWLIVPPTKPCRFFLDAHFRYISFTTFSSSTRNLSWSINHAYAWLFSDIEVWESAIVYEGKACEQSWIADRELIDSLINITAQVVDEKIRAGALNFQR